jgi:serine/threonine protein kinase
MNVTYSNCDDTRLRELLESSDAIVAESDAAMAAAKHVEHCPRCQARLAELAAEPDAWTEITELLTVDAETERLSAEARERTWHTAVAFADKSGSAGSAAPPAWTEAMARQLLAPPSHPEMLGRLGRYEVERLIGAGGMGIVFKGFDTELHRPVAIKVLAPHLAGSGAARQRFAREARAAAAVVHEHVVAIHNVESDGAAPFLVMQFVAGESLQGRLDRQGPLELCEVLRIGRQTAAGLAAAHAQGLVHRDVKPSNILLEHGVERALLTDFGLARAADDASLTHTGHLPGTPHYMSPEQARGEPIDARSDLFSLGSVLYAMATGRPPFRAETSLAVLRRITDERPRPVGEVNAELPAWFERLVARLHAKSPAERFNSADDVAELLEQCLAHVRQPAAAPLPKQLVSPPATQQPRWLWTAAIGGSLASVAVVAIAAAIVLSRPDAEPANPSNDGSAGAQAADLSPHETDWQEPAGQIEALTLEANQLADEVAPLWPDSGESSTPILVPSEPSTPLEEPSTGALPETMP